MGKIIKTISAQQKKDAYALMAKEQLVFILEKKSAINNLSDYVRMKNGELYGKAEFTFIESKKYDKHLIVAAVPQLGAKELGLFAAEDIPKGTVIATYKGIDKWGVLPFNELKEKIKNWDESGDYCWEVPSKKGGMAIDSRLEGSVARFVNESLHRNIDVRVSNNRLEYFTRCDVKFGEELTTSYGQNYFSEDNPRVEYKPQTLQEILGHLFAKTQSDRYSPLPITNLQELSIFLEAMSWSPSENQGTPTLNKNLLTAVEVVSKLPEERSNSNKSLYLDHEIPLLVDLTESKNFQPQISFTPCRIGGRKVLENLNKVTIEKTSKFKLFALPTSSSEGKRRFSLFAGQTIIKDEQVCVIKGEKISKKEIATRKNLDANLLFQINSNTHLYCEHQGSEALFVQGVNNEHDANVRVSCSHNTPSYIATEDIKPGDEIVAFYGNAYSFASKPTTLKTVINNFNQNQLSWDAWISQESRILNINLFPHIMTPGRDMDFTSDHELMGKSSQNQDYKDKVYEELQQLPDYYDYEDIECSNICTKELHLPTQISTSFQKESKNWQPNYFQADHKRNRDTINNSSTSSENKDKAKKPRSTLNLY